MPSGPVRLATAAMASATASNAGAAATASWFDSPRQMSPSREIASFVRSIWSASCSETTTPKASTSSVAWRSVAVSIREMAIEPSSPKSCPATAARSAAGTKLSMAALIAPTRWSSGSAIRSSAESPSRSSASAAGPVPAAAWLRRRVRSFVACSMPDIDTPASSPARSSVWIEATVVPSDWASLACASTVSRPERTIATPAAVAAATAAAARHAHAARETGEPGIRRLHLPAQPPEAARPGLAHAFQLGAHLSPADRRKADGHTLVWMPRGMQGHREPLEPVIECALVSGL
jgi:hypothetical protein